MVTLEASMGQREGADAVLVVAHYDAAAASPSLAKGADANGSGVVALMELARMWSHLYRSSKSRPSYNLVFLLSSGGKMNFLGSKKWLEDQKDSNNELLSSVKLVVCLDGELLINR